MLSVSLQRVGDSDLRNVACHEVKNKKMHVDMRRAVRGREAGGQMPGTCRCWGLQNSVLWATCAGKLQPEIHTWAMPMPSDSRNMSRHGPSSSQTMCLPFQ